MGSGHAPHLHVDGSSVLRRLPAHAKLVGLLAFVLAVVSVPGPSPLALGALLCVAALVLLGTGVLGGFTTMSAASAETFVLLDRGATGLGLAYCVGTLFASLLAVLLVDRLTTEQQRQDFELAEGDE